MNKSCKTMKHQQGVSLTEMLLGVGVALMMLLVMGKMQIQALNDTRAKNAAETYQAVLNSVSQYVKSNRSALIGAMESGTNANQYCVIDANPTTGTGGTTKNDTTLKTCTLDVNWLIGSYFDAFVFCKN